MLTHLDEKNRPTMVDVSSKRETARTAVAQSSVQLPEEMRGFVADGELHMKKGPVFQTAIVAGTMAVKRTSELIPFCHQVPIESCKFDVAIDENLRVTIRCAVKTTYKTGVEMEALQGATTAALTIYDMCKAVSHRMEIVGTKLVTKYGGKSTVLSRPLYGLVLTGGKSERMKRDKALLAYSGKPQALALRDLLAPYCAEVYLSARAGQWNGSALAGLPTIVDQREGLGPIGGLVSAFAQHPEAHWLVVACDLPFVNANTIETLLQNFDDARVATCFKNSEKGFPEPLCAIYSPLAHALFVEALANDVRCPVKILKQADCTLLEPRANVNLSNVNTPEEFAEASR